MAKHSISPLRYPGGKLKIYNDICTLINNNFANPPIYIEAYCGGAGLALSLLFNEQVSKIIINDYDYAIYCFWKSILENTKEFIRKINEINVTIDEWYIQKNIYNNQNNYTELEIGFAAFFLNRTNRSGIIKAGPIGGISQDGKYKIDCRFNKKKLIDKIKLIASMKKKIKIYNEDALKFISRIKKMNNEKCFIYFDPPYVNRGPELYKNYYQLNDHKKVSEKIIKKLKDYKWIVTYDNVEVIHLLYSEYRQEEFEINYSAGANKVGKEIIIYSNNISLSYKE